MSSTLHSLAKSITSVITRSRFYIDQDNQSESYTIATTPWLFSAAISSNESPGLMTVVVTTVTVPSGFAVLVTDFSSPSCSSCSSSFWFVISVGGSSGTGSDLTAKRWIMPPVKTHTTDVAIVRIPRILCPDNATLICAWKPDCER